MHLVCLGSVRPRATRADDVFLEGRSILSIRRMIKRPRMAFCLQNSVPLPQTRVLGLGCYIDRNIAVGVFPECEEIFVG